PPLPAAFWIALSITWLGTFSFLAFSTTLRRTELADASGTPCCAATYSCLLYLEYSFELLAAVLKMEALRLSNALPIRVLPFYFPDRPSNERSGSCRVSGPGRVLLSAPISSRMRFCLTVGKVQQLPRSSNSRSPD